MKKFLSVAATLALSATLLSPAAPANAAIDAGQKLMAIGCGSDNGKLYDINSTDGTATTVGAGFSAPSSTCSYQGAFNPIDGYVYYFQRGSGTPSVLLRVDKETGNHTIIGQTSLSGSPVTLAAMAVDSSGNAFAFDEFERFYSVSLFDGSLTLIAENSPVSGGFYSLAFDLTTDTLYAVLGVFGTPQLQTVNPSTGAFTSTGVTLTHYVMGITLDEDGLMWVLTNDVQSEVYSYDIGTNTWSYKGDLNVGGVDVYSQSMFFYGTVTGPPSNGDVQSKRARVFFDGNSAELTKTARATLRRKFNAIPDGADLRRVVITSYIAGSVSWPALAEGRVHAVKGFLKRLGVDARFVLKPNAAGIGYSATNRRADIEFRYASVPS